MTLPVVFTANGQTGYNLTKSLRFRSSASAYLTRTPASAGSSTKMTFSFWTKRGQLSKAFQNLFTSGASAGNGDATIFTSGDAFRFWLNGGSASDITTSQVFRDPSAWYHIVIAIDTTQATASNRVLIYVNGTQITSFSSVAYPNQNYNIQFFNTTTQQQIGYGVTTGNGGNYYDGYQTEINFIDGQQLTPSSFGSTNALTGVWQPAKYTGSYGTNGFYLPFTNTTSTTTLGYDFSGNSNNWTSNNISLTAGTTYDSMTDVPTLTSATTANYAVLNPIAGVASGSSYTITQGNLNAVLSSSANVIEVPATMALPTSGKWYWETNIIAVNTTYAVPCAIGISDQGGIGTASNFTNNYYYYVSKTGNKFSNGTNTAYGATYTASDVIGVALDMDAGTLVFYKNNTSQGTAYTGLSGTYYPKYGSSDGCTVAPNFGQQGFTYTPPSGFVALNTYNLPTSTIVKGNTVMDATLWTGNGSSQTITNASAFKPDLVWGKARSAATSNEFYDSIRGVSQSLLSNTTGAENNWSPYGVTAFNSNGFSVNDITSSGYGINESGVTYVGWQWQAGQGTSSSNTSGSITSTVSVNASAGFSVVTYTGTNVTATVGHGLGVAPSMFMIKRRNSTSNWGVYHSSIGSNSALFLDLTDAATSPGPWNNTAPTSSVFTIATGSFLNQSGGTYVAYCWSEIAGFSKFGSYTGNGSTDGPFVYTGFRPKYLMIKITTTAGYYWMIKDSVRDPYNTTFHELYANVSDAEYTASSYQLDLLSNGFKIKNNGQAYNGSGDTYIYMAFAENPTKFALAR